MKTKPKIIGATLAAALLLLTCALAACGSPATAGNGLSGTITTAGSTTVQPLAELFADAFKSKHPGATVTIQGGGSSVGIKSATDGTVDIGAVSRELKSEEKPGLVEHVIAKDGIAIITHPSNAVKGISKEQVRDIYAGNIINWNELGGVGKAINVVAREEGSGTRTAFEEMVMGKQLITSKAILQSSNGAIRATVAGDPNSIGFLSFGYLDSSVKALAIDGVVGSKATALDGSYPVVRPLIFVTRGEPQGAVKEFIDFCLGAEGQKIVEDEGYIPVN